MQFTCNRPSSVRWMVTHLLGWAPFVVIAVINESNSSRFSFNFLTNDSIARLAKLSLSPPCRWHINEWTIDKHASADVGAPVGIGFMSRTVFCNGKTTRERRARQLAGCVNNTKHMCRLNMCVTYSLAAAYWPHTNAHHQLGQPSRQIPGERPDHLVHPLWSMILSTCHTQQMSNSKLKTISLNIVFPSRWLVALQKKCTSLNKLRFSNAHLFDKTGRALPPHRKCFF